MIFKFNDKSKGRSGVVEYHLDERVKEGTAYTVRGNPELTKALIRSQHRVHKYKSGGLMFHEDDNVTEEQEQDIMDSFEDMMFVGIDKSRYHIIWIKHVDKGRVELNFIIVREDLSSGKDLDIHSHKRDLPLFNMWKNGINKKYGFADPEARSRKQTPKQRAESKTKNRNWLDAETSFIVKRANVEQRLIDMAHSGRFENRDAMISFLEEKGFEISRKNDKGFSVKHPSIGQKAKRLMSNVCFKSEFKSLEDLKGKEAEEVKDKPIYFKRSLYLKYLESRRQRHLKKYPAPVLQVPEEEIEIEEEIEYEFRNTESLRARDKEERASRRRVTASAEKARRRESEVLERIGQYGTNDTGASTEAYRERVSSYITEMEERSEELAEVVSIEAELGEFEDICREGIKGFKGSLNEWARGYLEESGRKIGEYGRKIGEQTERIGEQIERVGELVEKWIEGKANQKPDVVAQARARNAKKRLLNNKGSTGGNPAPT